MTTRRHRTNKFKSTLVITWCLLLFIVKVKGTCEDNGGTTDCTAFEAAGECVHNPNYMSSHCAKSCQSSCLCPEFAASGRDADRSCLCGYWAFIGMCDTSPDLMGVSCQTSCNVIQSVDCGSAPDLEFRDKTVSSTAWGGNATYVCSQGSDRQGGALGLRYCKKNGKWVQLWYGDGEDPVCIPWVCPDPEPVTDATISLDKPGNIFGSKATYTCKEGMEITAGDETLTCGNKVWDGKVPKCELFTCGSPPTIEGATFTLTGTNFKDTATYSCAGTEAQMTGESKLTCGDDKTWGSPPVCVVPEATSPLVIYITVPLIILLISGVIVLVYYIFIFYKARRSRARQKDHSNSAGSQTSLISAGSSIFR